MAEQILALLQLHAYAEPGSKAEKEAEKALIRCAKLCGREY